MKTAIIASSYRTRLLISRGRQPPQCQMCLQSEEQTWFQGAPRLEALEAAPLTPAITRQCSQTFFKILLLTPWLRLPACMTEVFFCLEHARSQDPFQFCDFVSLNNSNN